MTYTLQQLSDLEDIRILKHRYFRGIDTADLALLESLFTDDVDIDYRGGDYVVKLRGRADMIEFLANSFNASAVAMHHGHMPEITLTGADSATGLWYLEDVFISLDSGTHLMGTAIYKDAYRRDGDRWKIAASEYDRIIEVVRPLLPDERVTAHYLAKAGRPISELTDVSRYITRRNDV